MKATARDFTGLTDTQTFTVVVVDNVLPAITSIPVVTAFAGRPYSYRVIAKDPEGSPITYSFDPAQPPPAGMTIGAGTGLISWTPTNAQVGPNPVKVLAADAKGASVAQNFTIDVKLNAAPVITSTPGKSATAGYLYRYHVVGIDADGDPLTYSIDGTPPLGMLIDPVSGMLTWSPLANQVGTFTVKVRARDIARLSTTQTFQIISELLAAPTASYDTPTKEWRIRGASPSNGATITVRLGSAAGPVIGTATVAAGTWSLRIANSTVSPGTTRTLHLRSSIGAKATAPFTVR